MTTNQSTLSMQKLRKNPDYKLKEERKRIISRIKSDSIPRYATLQKYNLTIEDVNTIRNEAGLKKIKIQPHQDIIYKPMNIVQQEINAATTKQIDQIQKEATVNVVENKEALDKIQQEAKDKYKNFIVNVDKKDLYSILTINKWFYANPGISDIKTNQKRAPGTITKMFGPESGKPGGYISQLFDKMLNVKDNIRKGININTIEKKYETFLTRTKKLYDQQSIVGHLSMLSVVMREYPGFDIEGEDKDQYNVLQKTIQKYQTSSSAKKIQKALDENTVDYDEIKQKVLNSPKVNSKMKLYMKLYEDFPTRDNLGKLKIIYHKITDNDKKNIKNLNKGENLIFIDENNITLAFINYKTHNHFGDIYHEFKGEYKKFILEYIKENPKSEYLFYAGKMSGHVKQMLLNAGVKTKDDPQGSSGNINYLRKAFVSKALNNITDPEDRVKLGNLMKHTPATSLKYNRKITEIYDKNKNIFEKIKYNENA